MRWVTRLILTVCLFVAAFFYLTTYQRLFERAFTKNLSSTTAGPTVRYYDWTVGKHRMAPDGVEKEMTLVNGVFPGPLIEANVGDRVVVNVHNSLNDESTSIHWHGLKQRGNNAMDGAHGVTQCGVPPGQNLTYTFDLDESGTFWWHSHSHHQRMEGMFGGLIVHSEKDHYSVANGQYDEEVIVLLNDQYFQTGDEVMSWYMSRRSQGFEPVPDNGLINGKNVFDCDRLIAAEDFKCDSSAGEHAEFKLTRDKKYRLRIINASAMANYQFSVDEHELRVIEADTTEVEAVNVHYLPIASGQRYSVIIDGNSSDKKAVFMRAEMNEECFNYPNAALDPEVRGIIRYEDRMEDARELVKRVDVGRDTKKALPESSKWKDTLPENVCLDLDDSLLEPVEKVDAVPADKRVVLHAKIMKLSRQDLKPYAFFNRTSWVPAAGAPSLFVELGHINASDTARVESVLGHPVTPKWGGDQMVVDLKRDHVVELIINNNDESPHPFHLHGHDFQVLRTYEPETMHGEWKPGVNYQYRTTNPMRRDTLTLPRFGHSVVRFRADNPGMWAFHCHIHWHMMSGMVMQFAEAPSSIDETIPEAMLDHCEIEQKAGEHM